MKKQSSYLALLILFGFSFTLYPLPYINLGATSFFDGGPLRSKPGWYLQQFLSYYHSDKIVFNAQGNLIDADLSPEFNGLAATTQLIYVSPLRFLKSHVGGIAYLPAVGLIANVDQNQYGIRSSGVGVGDLALGLFFQWDAIMDMHERPVIVNRFEINCSFPTGKDPRKFNVIYPGDGIFFIDPYIASTLFLTKDSALSWRFSYLWCGKDKRLDRQFGQAFHTNFSAECRLTPHLFIGLNGYFLQQLTDTKISGVSVPDSRERVLAIGPGFLYTIGEGFDFVFLCNLYFEVLALNRSQGVRLHFRLLKHF